MNYVPISWAYFMNGEFERAYQQMEYAYKREPDNALLQYSRALFQLYSGREKDAREYVDMVRTRITPGLFDQLILIQVYALDGNRAKVDEIMSDAFKASVRRDFQYPWHVAVTKTTLGDYEEALDWPQIAVNNCYANSRFLSELDPFLKPLCPHARFKKIVEQAKAESLIRE